MRELTRRSALRLAGSAAVLGTAGVAGARPSGDAAVGDLRLFAGQDTGGATEVVTQGSVAYVATGDGLTVVDWSNPARPAVRATVDVPGSGVHDVKVDGDLLAISSQAAPDDADVGTHFYDVGDPADPQLRGTWTELPAGVHNHDLSGDVAYLCREFPFSDSGLRVVDASDPTDPRELAFWAVEDAVDPAYDRDTNFVHDVFVQDGLAYLAYWDAGTVVLDVSDPADPTFVSQFGQAPDATEPAPYPSGEWIERAFLPPGNAHYVRPSPDGDLTYVGAETFPAGLVDDPDGDDYGGIKVFDTSDPADPALLTRIDPPRIDADVSGELFTAHNFDATANRLYTSWYDGGVSVFDVTDPTAPAELAAYDPDGSQFWTAVASRGFTVASDRRNGGLVFLHDDRGERRPPDFDGGSATTRGPAPPGAGE